MYIPPTSPDELVIETICLRHEVREFRCGEQKLEDWLRRNARKNTLCGYGRTFVAVKPGCPRVWAFFTLAASHVEATTVSAPDAPKMVSVVRLGRLAVQDGIQNIGIGRMIMGKALEYAAEAAERIGIHAMVVDAKNDGLIEFYRKQGFVSVIGEPRTMYLPLALVVAANRIAADNPGPPNDDE